MINKPLPIGFTFAGLLYGGLHFVALNTPFTDAKEVAGKSTAELKGLDVVLSGGFPGMPSSSLPVY